MPDKPQLGPVALCTLVTTDGQALADAYTGSLHQHVTAVASLDAQTASTLGVPELTGNASWLLANSRGRDWLHIIEHDGATPRDSLGSYGWLAMETNPCTLCFFQTHMNVS